MSTKEEKKVLDDILKVKETSTDEEEVVIKSEDNELLERVDKKLITEDGRQLLRD